MHALEHVPPPVATFFVFVLAGCFFWIAADPQRARGSDEAQARRRWLHPFDALLLDDMSNRALRHFALILGVGFAVVGVLGLFI